MRDPESAPAARLHGHCRAAARRASNDAPVTTGPPMEKPALRAGMGK